MTATNHALTGAALGLTIANPWLAVPAAFLSHFVLDAIPHFGFKGAKTDAEVLPKRWFKRLLMAEACMCFLIVAVLAAVQPEGWFVAAGCAFVATSPDLYSLPRFLYENGWASAAPRQNWFRRFHRAIQTERVWGASVELVWACCMLWVLANLL
ncbi:hypothetical protein CSA80_00835 [Candidatus Saccharibacteria bacterium]|nr:MAG: hypothetical protein CR973_02320 [Candidatus Saccharibacteria bacterium]PID99300.1 MAG: hypothetical protein CSA80_00835 [Candidatus Saccharibacteria bacterium]